MENIVETFDLTKIYNKKILAVDHINMQIREGETLGLLGPNGAGKTTTIRMFTTLTRPTSGRAIVAGYDVVKESRKVRECIGYSAEEAGVDENATGRENLVLHGHYHHLDNQTIRKRVAEVLELVGLTKDADRRVSTYSGGMRKRLEIATALIPRPKLLFLDEPTLGLDVHTRVHIWDYIRKLNEDGITILLTTHYLEEADKLCDRVAIIDHGRIIATGPPDELKGKIRGDVVSLTMPLQESEKQAKAVEKARRVLSGQTFVKELRPRKNGLNIYVNNGGSAVPHIVRLLDDADVIIETIALSRPSLDDVFIKYTGRTMREERGQSLSSEKIEREKRRRR